MRGVLLVQPPRDLARKKLNCHETDNSVFKIEAVMKYQLSTNSRSVLNSGLTDDYRKTIAEYIWNGFDALTKDVMSLVTK